MKTKYKNTVSINHMSVRRRNMTDSEFWEWFESKLTTTPSGCREWSACRFAQGYGVVRMNGKNIKAHRIALEHTLGRPVAPGMCALHSCNNPPCCNPEHLREGTNQENVDDKLRSDRQPRGETNGKAKLTFEQVEEIRRNSNSLTQRQLADLYGVKHACIGKIHRGKTWNLHIKE
jgi:HNH endonuclease